MLQLIDPENRPGLLVSVRDASEALAALAGGAHVIDVKEPDRGSLGAADTRIIDNVIRAVDGRAPVTAAAGELLDLLQSPPQPLPRGLSLFKIGLAGCGLLPDWKSQWLETISSIGPHADAPRHAVAVAYADWRTAGAPEPHDVLHAATQAGCPALLIDTWDKSAGGLFDQWPANELTRFLDSVKAHDLMLVLAGSLTDQSFAAAAKLRPDLVAVRTAACVAGRGGTVSSSRVASLCRVINDVRNHESATRVYLPSSACAESE
jgi:uncharacterized protein (UPF0264 family)